MATTWRHEATLDAPADAVYAWMTDFREDDHARPAFKRGAGATASDTSARRVISRQGNRIVLEDSWGRNKMILQVELRPPTREVKLEGQWGYRASWRAVPMDGATRVIAEGEMAPSGLMRLVAPLFAKRMLEQMRQDFEGHVEDMREGLEPKGGSGGGAP